MTLQEEVKEIYRKKFGKLPDLIVRAPGRINLIGEHTDYNGGFVLPAAVDQAVYLAIGKTGHSQGEWLAPQINSSIIIDFKGIRPSKTEWANYLLGVITQFHKKGLVVPAFNAVLISDIPIGGGMSSSAAITSATATVINNLGGFSIDKMQLAKFCQAAEHEYAGVNCGIMDMFASLFGKKDHVIRLDCRNLEYAYFPLKFPGYSLVLFDTGIKHSLAAGEYNLRRQYCEEGITILSKYHPDIKLLRDVPPDLLKEHKSELSETVYDCCLYIIDEIKRTQEACQDLQNAKVIAFGQKMYTTHDGLSRLYKVSCPELDFLVDAVKDNKQVAGARMMGGGFGGCTINLVAAEAVEGLFNQLEKEYKSNTGLQLKMYLVKAGDGAAMIE